MRFPPRLVKYSSFLEHIPTTGYIYINGGQGEKRRELGEKNTQIMNSNRLHFGHCLHYYYYYYYYCRPGRQRGPEIEASIRWEVQASRYTFCPPSFHLHLNSINDKMGPHDGRLCLWPYF